MTSPQMRYPNPDAPDQYSVFGTLVWMFVLALGIPMLVGIVIILLLVSMGYKVDDAVSFITTLDVGLILAVVSALISYPLFKTACYYSDYKGLPLQFLALKSIKLPTLLAVLAAITGLVMVEHLVSEWLAIPIPESMLEVKNNVQKSKDFVLVLLTICIIAPVVEELIFRGMAYRRIEQSRFGAKGAVVITSLVFTLVHIQYSWLVLLLLLPGSFLLGLIRYKTANLYYCIAAHIWMNLLSTVLLFTWH